ncbi:MAG: right-handed parallel beta-helix repeat-containing protein, partial [Candidatus Heimdallarchaeota archaeon]
LYNNFIIKNKEVGIFLEDSGENSLRDNIVVNNTHRGVWLQHSENCFLTENNVSSNQGECGIELLDSKSNTLSGNIVTKNRGYGVCLNNSGSCILYDNNVSDNQGEYGIVLHESGSCKLSDNTITNNYNGIYILGSGNNIVNGNFFSKNENYAIYLIGSANNLIEWNNFENNLIGGTSQAFDGGAGNEFKYNYWDEKTTPDTDHNEIVDKAYQIDAFSTWKNEDPYPLTSPAPPHQLTAPTILTPAKEEIVAKEIRIEWTPGSDSWWEHQISYSVYYSPDGGEEWILITSGLTTTEYLWNTTVLENGANYKIKINSTCSGNAVSEATSEIFTINNAYIPPPPPPPGPILLLIIITVITIITVGIVVWQKKYFLRQELPTTSFIVCLGTLTDEGITIQEKSEGCPFNDQELLSMIEYSAVLYQHGEIEDIYGPFPQTSISKDSEIEWHFLSFAFRVKDESAEDTRIVRKGGISPAILLVFYERQFDAIILAQKKIIKTYLQSVEVKDVSKITQSWITQIETDLQKLIIKTSKTTRKPTT